MAPLSQATELFKEIASLRGDLGRVEGKIDTFITQLGVQDNRTTELDVRTRKVENRQHWYSGLGAAIGVFFGLATGHGIKF